MMLPGAIAFSLQSLRQTHTHCQSNAREPRWPFSCLMNYDSQTLPDRQTEKGSSYTRIEKHKGNTFTWSSEWASTQSNNGSVIIWSFMLAHPFDNFPPPPPPYTSKRWLLLCVCAILFSWEGVEMLNVLARFCCLQCCCHTHTQITGGRVGVQGEPLP